MAARMLAYRIEQARDLGRAALGFAPAMNDRLGSTNSPAPAGVRDRSQGEHFEVSLARALTTLREAAPSLVRESEVFAICRLCSREARPAQDRPAVARLGW